ncbi:hypothetical protein KIW84_056524 [Lathyrus oleraceus]|uniref:Uncharacterized protein n=1 Tax=Pisum sativum TaxID=3888 RepID=A0A9D4WZR1_PEA|nr:hypothetical protein KIW84_056524 [Pisum sativum]
MCHGQLYQQRMKKAFDKKVKPRVFQEGDLVLKKVLSFAPDSRGKWTPNYEGPYVVKRAFSGGALILTTMDGEDFTRLVNSDAYSPKDGKILDRVGHLFMFLACLCPLPPKPFLVLSLKQSVGVNLSFILIDDGYLSVVFYPVFGRCNPLPDGYHYPIFDDISHALYGRSLLFFPGRVRFVSLFIGIECPSYNRVLLLALFWMMSVLGILPNSRFGWSPIICPVTGIPGVPSSLLPIMTFCHLAESDFPELSVLNVASREKPAGKERTTEPPPCVIYPKRGKGNARSKPRKEHGLATKEDGFGSRLCEGKVLGTLRIRSTLRDPRTKGKNIGC